MDFVTLTKDMVWKMLQAERKLDAFTQNGAIISLLFDKLEDKQKGKREYSRIWNWTWDKLRYNWQKIDSISELLLHKSQHPSSTPPSTPKITQISTIEHDSTPPNTPLTPHNYTNTNNTTYSKLLTNSSKHSKNRVTRRTLKTFSGDSWQHKFSLAHLKSSKRLGIASSSALNDQEKTLAEGADIFDKLERLDNHSQDEIKLVMTWLLQEDNWWIANGNYSSFKKLRRKDEDGQTFFKRFLIQARKPNGKSSKSGTGNSSYTPVSAYNRISAIASAALNPEQEPVARTGTGG